MAKDVIEEKAFWFCNGEGSVGKVAKNLAEFSDCLESAPIDSLEFHLREDKNDFEAWLKEIMEEPKLAESVKRIKKKGVKGEELRASMKRFSKKVCKTSQASALIA
jgi:hypothetical protein